MDERLHERVYSGAHARLEGRASSPEIEKHSELSKRLDRMPTLLPAAASPLIRAGGYVLRKAGDLAGGAAKALKHTVQKGFAPVAQAAKTIIRRIPVIGIGLGAVDQAWNGPKKGGEMEKAIAARDDVPGNRALAQAGVLRGLVQDKVSDVRRKWGDVSTAKGIPGKVAAGAKAVLSTVEAPLRAAGAGTVANVQFAHEEIHRAIERASNDSHKREIGRRMAGAVLSVEPQRQGEITEKLNRQGNPHFQAELAALRKARNPARERPTMTAPGASLSLDRAPATPGTQRAPEKML